MTPPPGVKPTPAALFLLERFSLTAKRHATLLQKASFVSGRDATSTQALADVLRLGESVVQPDDVALVRDPVLSDKSFSDREGRCWKQSEGASRLRLCA